MVFATLNDLLNHVLGSCAGRTPYSPSELRVAARSFVAWAEADGWVELDPELMFTRRNIERFVQHGLPHYTAASRGNTRSKLLRMSEVILDPDGLIPRLSVIGPAAPLRPYSAAEIVSMRSWAMALGAPSRVASGKALLAMTLGAGLTAAELAEVRTPDVNDRYTHLAINVRGPRARIVPVLRDWADDLREVLELLPGGVYVFRSERSHSWPNVISNFVGRRSDPRPQPQRLRSTWIVQHLTAGTNVKTLVRWAGVDSLEAFTRYLEFVGEPEETQAIQRYTHIGSAA